MQGHPVGVAAQPLGLESIGVLGVYWVTHVSCYFVLFRGGGGEGYRFKVFQVEEFGVARRAESSVYPKPSPKTL